MKIRLLLLVAVLLTGCASDKEYYAAVTAQANAQKEVKIKQYEAMQAMAGSSDAAKVAAVIMVGMGVGAQSGQQAIAAPRSFGDHALQWAGILVPSIMQGYGIRQNALTSQNASDNSRLLGMSTNEAFVGIAGKIQAPAAPQANITTTTNIGGDGNVGSGSQSKTDRHDTTTTDRHDVTADDHSVTNPPAMAP